MALDFGDILGLGIVPSGKGYIATNADKYIHSWFGPQAPELVHSIWELLQLHYISNRNLCPYCHSVALEPEENWHSGNFGSHNPPGHGNHVAVAIKCLIRW